METKINPRTVAKRAKQRLVIAANEGGGESHCSLCGRPVPPSSELQLCREEDLGKVCGNCGTEHEPALAALLDLARVADRIGRMGRHVLVPPLGALLDLAHAAEGYTAATDRRRRLRKAG